MKEQVLNEYGVATLDNETYFNKETAVLKRL